MRKIDLNNYEEFLLDYMEGNLSEAEIRELRNFALLHPELNIDLDQEELPSIFKEDDKADFKNVLFKTENDLPGYQLIAYIEGQLSEEEKKKFEKELADDPDLARELEMYQKTVLNKEDLVFEGKSSLERTEDEFLTGNRSIRYVEGLLSAEEKSDFENDLNTNKSLQQETALVEKTVLAPELSIVYPDKSELKKRARVIALFSYRSVAAMAAAILLLIGLIVLINSNDSKEKTESGLAEKTDPKNNTSIPSVKNGTVPAVKENTNPASVNVLNKEMKKSSLLASKNSGEQKKHIVKDTASVFDSRKQLVKKEEEKPLPEVIFPEKISSDSALAILKKENIEETAPSGKILIMIPVEEDDEAYNEPPEKKGFWKKAVGIARQANVLGMKGVNGEEKAKGDYVLSFAGFSVEKK